MLTLINAEREKAGVGPVVLGTNNAAQLHADASLEHCFSSHWGIDGLKPYMRYSLAGGYQSNGENGIGLDYCVTASDGYSALRGIRQEIQKVMDSWMGSSGHRRNILDGSHKKVNIGIAWDRYNIKAVQHFEGDYVEYDRLPTIENGILTMSGKVKNGVAFEKDEDLGVQIFYDQPPHPLTRGQISRTYCYDYGLLVAALRWPLPTGFRYSKDKFTVPYKPCLDPYDVPEDAPAPGTYQEAREFWQQAYEASQIRQEQDITVPWITALEWRADEEGFSAKADLNGLLSNYGNGVYTLAVWGSIGSERAIFSRYSMFVTSHE